jgi:hypothetical protein
MAAPVAIANANGIVIATIMMIAWEQQLSLSV